MSYPDTAYYVRCLFQIIYSIVIHMVSLLKLMMIHKTIHDVSSETPTIIIYIRLPDYNWFPIRRTVLYVGNVGNEEHKTEGEVLACTFF